VACVFGHRPKRQKHVNALNVAVVIPPRRDLKTTNQSILEKIHSFENWNVTNFILNQIRGPDLKTTNQSILEKIHSFENWNVTNFILNQIRGPARDKRDFRS
jgi:hypothetical protein